MCCIDVTFFSQIEGKTFHQQKDYRTPFIAVVWNQTQTSISEAGLDTCTRDGTVSKGQVGVLNGAEGRVEY